jgi:hypothetical protein
MHLLLVRWIWQRLIRCWVMPEFNIDIKNILTRVRSIIWPSLSSSICRINQGIPKVRFPSHLCKMQHKKQQSIRLTMVIKTVVTIAFSSSKTYHKSMKTDIFFKKNHASISFFRHGNKQLKIYRREPTLPEF